MQSVGHEESPDGHHYQTLTTSSMASLTADTVRTKTRGTTVVNQEREEISGMSCKEKEKSGCPQSLEGFFHPDLAGREAKGPICKTSSKKRPSLETGLSPTAFN